MNGVGARFNLRWPGFELDVNLNLPARGVTALFGHSGSGKTSLLRCMAGLIRADKGSLTVNGEVWQDANQFRPTYLRPLGYVFQEASLFPHLNVQANLTYGLRRQNTPQPARLAHAIDLMSIGHLLKRKPQTLSGGERQRVSLAQALALAPELLLMDEPLAALDVPRKLEILPYLEALRAELEIPIIYVSHAPDEVARLADYLVVMREGKAVAEGPICEVLTRLDLPIRLGEDAGALINAQIGAIDSAWHLARMDFPGGSLWTRNPGLPLNSSVRVRVLARDVSLSQQPPSITSIQNQLQGTIEAICDDEHPSQLLVQVRIGAADGPVVTGATHLIARLTKRSAAVLTIAVGQRVWVQVKSVALL